MAYDIVSMYLNIRHKSDFAATEHLCLEYNNVVSKSACAFSKDHPDLSPSNLYEDQPNMSRMYERCQLLGSIKSVM